MGANIDENLRHEKVSAEISNLISNSAKLQAETMKFQVEIEKMRKETMMYPLVVGSGATLAIVAIAKLFL